MLAVQGYYDGVTIKPLEKITAKPNQRVIITIMDEFVEPVAPVRKKRMRGILAQYAKPELREKEKCAWARAVVEKYEDAQIANRRTDTLERIIYE